MGTNGAGGDSDAKMASKIYDRSIRLWGKDSQQRIISAKVLVVGLRSLSAEICKNLVLAGIKHVSVADDTVVAPEDVGAHLFLREEHVGKSTRADATLPGLRELNAIDNTGIVVVKEDGLLTEDGLKGFQVVILTEGSRDRAAKTSALCRKLNIAFFYAQTHGLFGSFFLDLGETFQYTAEKKADPDDKKQEDTTMSSETTSYVPFSEAMAAPWGAINSKKVRVSPVFYALEVVYAARERLGRLPTEEDLVPLQEAKEGLTTEKGAKAGVFDDDLIQMVAAQAECELSAVCSIVGGLVSDQAIKAVSLREKPLRNYMVYDGRDGSGCVYFLSHDFTQ